MEKITFEDIKNANESIITIDVKGKEYSAVNERIKAFRMNHPLGTIATNIESLQNGVVVMSCEVKDEEGNLLGKAFAYEKENSTFINKTSFIENCCTSATGRALGYAGYGIDLSVASAEEVQNAINNQNNEIESINSHEELEIQLDRLIAANKVDYSKLCQKYKLAEEDIHHMSIKQLENAIANIDKFEKVGE